MKKPGRILILFLTLIVMVILQIPGVERAKAAENAIIQVNTFADELNYPTGDGDCSLREALKAANENIAVDTCAAGSAVEIDRVQLQSGIYSLSLSGAGEDGGSTGDLDILGSVELIGMGVGATIIDGSNLDRVFHLIQSGITVSMSQLTIRNGQVSSGRSGGGGILASPGTTLNLSLCRIYDNDTPDALGGGIDNYQGIVMITHCTIENNSADEGGGIYNDGTLNIYQSLVDSNYAETQGGGIKNSVPGGSTVLENVSISRNLSNGGSAIFSNGSLFLTNSTINRNVGSGAGIANIGEVTFRNTIVVGTIGTGNCSGTGTFTSAGNNLEDGNTCQFNPAVMNDLINTNPQLEGTAPLNNGGITKTWALGIESPAIDAGNNSGCPTFDQRGYSRPRDGDGDRTEVCDIGAFEVQPDFYFPILMSQ